MCACIASFDLIIGCLMAIDIAGGIGQYLRELARFFN